MQRYSTCCRKLSHFPQSRLSECRNAPKKSIVNWQFSKIFGKKYRVTGVGSLVARSPSWLEAPQPKCYAERQLLAKPSCRVMGAKRSKIKALVHFSQTFRMQECAKTFDNKLQILEAFQKMSRMGTELLVLAVWLHRVLLCWRHHRSSVRQKENC